MMRVLTISLVLSMIWGVEVRILPDIEVVDSYKMNKHRILWREIDSVTHTYNRACIYDLGDDGLFGTADDVPRTIFTNTGISASIDQNKIVYYDYVVRKIMLTHIPVIEPVEDKVVKVGEALKFKIMARDDDNDLLSFAEVDLPPGASLIDNGDNTATFSWEPDDSQVGLHKVIFSASDGNLVDTATVMIKVRGNLIKLKYPTRQ